MEAITETLSRNEVISCLWNKNVGEKCRIGLADAIVYENGLPARWYVTGRTGEVVKKKSVDLPSVSDRWLKICSQQNSTNVAILLQDGGIIKILSANAWKTFVESTAADTSILSLHCFVKGNHDTFYRNSFELKDNVGRFTTSTSSYVLPINNQKSDPVSMYYDSDISLIECRAISLRNIMDLATNTIIRYMEMMLQIKVLKLSVDYVIDTKSQLWVLWTSSAYFIRGTNLSGLTIGGLSSPERGGGRMSWAGLKYAEEYDEAVFEGRIQSPLRTMSTIKRTKTDHQTSIQKNDGNHVDSSVKASSKISSTHLNLAASVIDDANEAIYKGKRKQLNRDIQPNFMVTDSTNKDINEQKYPNPFKCRGDYCNIRVHGIGALMLNPSGQHHSFEKFFSRKELEILRNDKDYGKMMEYGADGPALAAISMKSIVHARQERRGINSELDKSAIWEQYPLTPRQKSASLQNRLETIEQKSSSNDGIDDQISTSSLQKHQEQFEVLEKDKEHRHHFSKGMATYYDQVRVCGVCYNMYALLDWARELLGKSDSHTFMLEAQGAGLQRSDKIELSKSTHTRDQGNSSPRHSPSRSLISASGQPSLYNDRKSETVKPKSNASEMHANDRASKTPGKRKTWRDYEATQDIKKSLETGNDESKLANNVVINERKNFSDLDVFLRKGATSLADKKAKEKDEFMKSRILELVPSVNEDVESSMGTKNFSNVYQGCVLLGCDDIENANAVITILEESYFDVCWVRDGRQVLNELVTQSTRIDCILVQLELSLGNAFEVAKGVRNFERDERKRAAASAAAQGKGLQPATKRYPIVCFTKATSPNDIKSYMSADMDGCVSYPVNKASLLNTVRAAVPHHLAVINSTVADNVESKSVESKVYKLGAMGTLQGSMDSTTIAAKSLSLSSAGTDDEIAVHGVIQIDADTRVPYMVLDASRSAKVILSDEKPFFNLVICHDIFDTAERFKIFMRPIVERYLGMQVLLWNYPGQAFTEWRKEQLLNNEYIASCFNEVLGQIGDKGTKDFDSSRPFYVLGYGNGANIASFYAAHYVVPNLRGIINVNGWAYVDSYLAGVMHDCINIFQCAPASRPDLPVYFMSRFLFAKDYLAKVSVPLALNIYTAVHNPISLQGRISLCKGVLQAVDIRKLLREIDSPMIVIQSTQDTFSRPMHTEPFVSNRGGEVRSIYKVLRNQMKTCIIWMKSGHEVFQECRKPMQQLIEQLLTGFHEKHDISFPPAPVVDKKAAEQGILISNLPWEQDKKLGNTIEDKFIDNVLEKIQDLDSSQRSISSASVSLASRSSVTHSSNSNRIAIASQNGERLLASPSHSIKSLNFTSNNPDLWEEYSKVVAEGQIMGAKGTYSKKSKKISQNSTEFAPFDPTSVSFGRQDSTSSKSISSNPNIHEYSEVKEYMSWRLKRNKKRLQRLQGAARIIQGAFRAFLARKFVQNIRRHKAAAIIQRCFRGWLGKCNFLDQARRVWATLMIQRTWRGYLSRKWFLKLRRRIAAAAQIQRVFRGHRSRKFVKKVKEIRYHAASIIQSLYRKVKARKEAWRKKHERNASIHIERIFRGHLGRKRAISERDKFIFSKSQSQGIEFGRQMLLEHKLHATKLQSDVTLLTQEKVASEEQVEALLEEISSFEEGVRVLEKEMHQLARVEAEASGFMDEDSRYELREQKIRLDKEFGEMLTKISNRKDMLNDLERKLSAIDKTRQSKEEELRTLERKLVVLLEEQQNELNAIKRKQDVRGALLAASHEELMKATSIGSGAQALTINGSGGPGGHVSSGSGGSGGPSLQEKKQAAQLMQSTETLMKFGFMSMSMTYFSSLNMIKALRTVSAQDTVMAALADVHSQRAVGFGGGDTGGSQGKGQFIPDLKPGQLSGQESLRVSAWSVDDVSKWLQAISLGQYSEAFIDAAIDGEFLYDLNDDDLKNTLGIEHRLHRKKILQCVYRLKLAEAQRDNRINNLLRDGGGLEPPFISPDDNAPPVFPSNPFQPGGEGDGISQGGPGEDRRFIDGPKVSLVELFSFVRHSKLTLLKEAVDYLPNKKFDKTLVKVGFVEGHGTVYVEGYERLPYHMNKTDEYGNTMLSLACQNGNAKICKYLVAKGCNPNHQNKTGQTPAHFAVSYKFFELSQWLFENGALDYLTNEHGLTPYDGLAPDGEGDDDGGTSGTTLVKV